MFHRLKTIERYPPWRVVNKYMPEAFKRDSPNTRLIIVATEFQVHFLFVPGMYFLIVQEQEYCQSPLRCNTKWGDSICFPHI